MGCDIHAAIEYRENGVWVAILRDNKYFGKWDGEPKKTARLDFGRNYDAFAILANVRNGSGFAGCDTGDGFKFISENRGLPEDISQEARDTACTGDHSDTFVTAAEILAFDWTQRATLRGWVDAVTFEKWDRMKEWDPWPDSWSGGVSGGNVEHVSIKEMRQKVKGLIGDKRGDDYSEAMKELQRRHGSTYCLIDWEVSYADAAKHLWTEIVPLMLKLGKQYGYENVRMVMNFDS